MPVTVVWKLPVGILTGFLEEFLSQEETAAEFFKNF